MAEQAKNVQVRLTAGAALDFAEVLADSMDHMNMDLFTKAKQAGDGDGSEAAKLGAEILQTMLKYSRESAFKFLASAAGMTAAELREEPLPTLIEIIRQIKEDPELKDFYEQARGMLS
jgi:hypothetical protein